MAAKITSIIYSILLITLVVGVAGVFMGKMNESYPINNYAEGNVSSLGRLNNITAMAEELSESSELVTGEGGDDFFDYVGFYFGKGWASLGIAKEAVTVAGDMATESLHKIGFGTSTSLFTAVVGAALLIFIILGVIVSTLVKREL